MDYIKGIVDFKLHNSVVSLGKFDGIHLGHRCLLDYAISSKKEGKKAVVFTFDMETMNQRLHRESELIYTEEEKKEILDQMGIDTLIAYPFTEETSSMEPEEFIRSVLVEKLDAKKIVVGTDFGFGHNRSGTVSLLKKFSVQYGYEVVVFDKIKMDQEVVSSTRIRKEIQKGNMELVNQMLGRTYFIKGVVEHGNQIGRTLGMPTANLVPPSNKLLPPNGVYASFIWLDKILYYGITNIGYKPTVGNQHQKGVETTIFDFQENIYGKELKVGLVTYERKEQKFSSIEELKLQLQKDKQFGMEYFMKKEAIGS